MATQIRAIALDVDGTLAGADHRVSAGTARTLRTLAHAGLAVIIVTGRTESAALRISTQCGLTSPVVSCNGAVVTEPESGQRLRWHVLATDTTRRVVAFAQAEDLESILWTAEHMYARQTSTATALLEEINDEPVVIAPFEDVPLDQVVKVMLTASPARLDAVQGRLSQELPLVMRSMDVFYETSNPEASKWEALHYVLRRLRIDPRQCMGIADGDTDVAWLARIGVPVAVENARPAVLKIASVHIGHHADDAVAHFLRQYFELR